MENEPYLSNRTDVSSKEMPKKGDNEPSPAKRDKSDIKTAENITNFDSIVQCLSENVLVEYLHDVLSFLLSDRRELHFPKASGYAELFLVNILKDLKNLNCKYFNKRCTSMSKQIVKVLDTKKDVFKCISSYETNNGRSILLYKKEYISKLTETTCCDGDACCSTSGLKSIAENLHHECPDHHSHKVSQTFKTRWLKTTLRFIKDDYKHKHKYPEMSPVEATFVYSLITKCKEHTDIGPDSYYTPLKEAMQIFSIKYFFELTYVDTYPNGKLSLMLEKVPKNIKSIVEGDSHKGSRFRNMKFIKQPKLRTSDENRAGRVVSRLKNQERLKPESSNRLLGAISTPPNEEERCSRLTAEEPKLNGHACCSHNVDRLNLLAAKRSRKVKAGGKGSNFQTRDRTPERTDKLIKAMSVPIKSDKAMKMMYGMGWDGGALGVRSGGITEPIIPTLDIQAGAGFGHTSSPKKLSKKAEAKSANSKTRIDFRVEICGYLLEMITSDETIKEIHQDFLLTKRDRGFIDHAVRAANERNNIGTNDPRELKIWGRMLEELTSNPEWHITSFVSNDKRLIIFKKDDSPYISKKKKRKLQKKLSIQNIPQLPEGSKKMITSEFIRTLTDTYITPYAGFNVSTKASTGISFRVAILLHILELLKHDRKETEISFDRILNDNEIEYIGNTVVKISLKKKHGSSKLERELLIEIKDNIEGYSLRVELLNDQKSFILHKVDRKPSHKSSRDVSNATCSTDDNVKNYYSHCSDDSDAGHDDVLENDDNDDNDDKGANNYCYDELNKSNNMSEDGNVVNVHNDKEEVQEHASVPLDCDSKEKLPDESVYFDVKKEIIKSMKSETDNNPKYIDLEVLKMEVQDFEKDTDINVLKKDIQELDKSTEFNVMQSVTQDSEKYTDDLKTVAQNFSKDTNSDDFKTDFQDFEKYTHFDQSDTTDIQDFENNTEMNTPDFRKHTVFDVLKTAIQGFNKITEIGVLKTDMKDSEKLLISSVFETDVKNIEKGCESIVMESREVEVVKDNLEEEEVKPRDNKEVENIDTHISERSGAEENLETNYQINKPQYIKRVYLVKDDYPREEVDTEFAKSIQILISKQIEKSTELPLLKCHGVKDGALVYSCHSEKTLQWLETVCSANRIKIIIPKNGEVRYKMYLKMNSYIDYTSVKLFKMLQLYNEGLPTESWLELSVEKSSDTLTFVVEIDEKSLKYIKDSNFTLFAGIDQVQFSVILH